MTAASTYSCSMNCNRTAASSIHGIGAQSFDTARRHGAESAAGMALVPYCSSLRRASRPVSPQAPSCRCAIARASNETAGINAGRTGSRCPTWTSSRAARLAASCDGHHDGHLRRVRAPSWDNRPSPRFSSSSSSFPFGIRQRSCPSEGRWPSAHAVPPSSRGRLWMVQPARRQMPAVDQQTTRSRSPEPRRLRGMHGGDRTQFSR